ncbi:MAG: RNA-directed DNA polymerase [Sphingobacteriales bacterium]|nr:MAG: RNA-directed DNA polymerase [Sphingobacteriales bacterium]
MFTTKPSLSEYKLSFSKEARRKDYNDYDIKEFLDYAEILYLKDLPIIYNIKHFSLLVGYKETYLARAAETTFNFYRSFDIRKRNGKLRKIDEPLPSLKEIQTWILTNILYKLDCSKYSKAYKKKNSIKTNAKFHRDQDVVLSLDVKDYFGSIRVEDVEFFFADLGYEENLSGMLASLCCLNGSLPQGSPTSPYLSNLITIELDNDLSELAKLYNVRYTRYADDITFSGTFTVGVLINKAKEVATRYGFEINDKKTRAMGKHEQQLVTGIVVNTKKLQVSRERRKDLRQQLYYIQKFGLENHLAKRNINKRNYLQHLLGLTNHILMVNPKDEEALRYKQVIFSYMND